VFVGVCVLVCPGTTNGISHPPDPDAHYRQYQTYYTGCTYIDGNVEIVYLTNETTHDLSFLKVPTFMALTAVSTERRYAIARYMLWLCVRLSVYLSVTSRLRGGNTLEFFLDFVAV